MGNSLLLTFNTGSSTIKFGVFTIEHEKPRRIGKGLIDFRQHPPSFHLQEGSEIFDADLKAELSEDLHEVVDEILGWISRHFDLSDVKAVGHRIVHGGDLFVDPTLIDDDVIDRIENLVPLAPLHQPQSLRLIRAIRNLRPNVIQTASFDTAFHATNSDLVRRFALPRELHDHGVKRYGFHGLSYSFIAGELRRIAPTIADKKVIIAHLGSGCSLCGMSEGVSRDTSMGFSTLDGVPMATRPGALDVGVLLHLFGEHHQSFEDVEDLLYHRSGLMGVSGISGDTRELLASHAPQAREALDLFTFRIAGEAARIANTLGGVDALVFTAGIGEHQPPVRAAICAHLNWLGVELDQNHNVEGGQEISTPSSRVKVLVVPTDEEQVIANEALALTTSKRD
ncbi:MULTISPECIES: acetate/propionate family kinase [Agrobacterium]|uniref:Acetate kinase n=1 Tax=Agrobacterium pusense TaxID=648995 RepID=A0AA44IXN6_9HYPH|nr:MULTISPECIES: acetate/propionate family kinase [Agrobacterium]PZU71230.1 MAG: acetate/propionate family kinase [Rhizobium sp.]HAU77390.1 acetate/propionate family kinase [Agrobacterium sp.]NRF07202.1 acetate/propionate family kinase [Agrobacterium pusense]NRF17756.1 acetate/propionate family kinase [Agrobacterium pusense]RAL96271.1 acetate/propionate family kinase [Agrobacterium sp. MS2]